MREICEQRASSLAAHAWCQSGHTFEFENFSSRSIKESVSLRGRPNMICAGEMLQSGSGVLCSYSMAHRKWL